MKERLEKSLQLVFWSLGSFFRSQSGPFFFPCISFPLLHPYYNQLNVYYVKLTLTPDKERDGSSIPYAEKMENVLMKIENGIGFTPLTLEGIPTWEVPLALGSKCPWDARPCEPATQFTCLFGEWGILGRGMLKANCVPNLHNGELVVSVLAPWLGCTQGPPAVYLLSVSFDRAVTH